MSPATGTGTQDDGSTKDAHLSRRGPGPERTPLIFAAAIGAGRLDVAAGCFARDACLVTPGATAIHGREQIGALLAQLIDRGSRIEVVLSTCLRAGEVAFARQRWALSADGPEGARYTEILEATLVLRRLEEEWKLAIAMPWS